MSSTSAGVGPDGKIYCKHMEEAAKRKSNTAKHPNRNAYCCKRPPGDPTKCNFWLWADELQALPKESTIRASTASTSSAVSPSKQEGHGGARPTSSHIRPGSQNQPSPSSEIVTPRSRRRLEDIEAGLKQREHDLSPTRPPGPSEAPAEPLLATTSSSIIPAVAQPPSPVPTEIDSDEVEPTQPRKTFSFLGLYSPELPPSTIKDESRPSTPKKRRLTTAAATSDTAPSGGRVPLTPPQTTRRITEPDQTQSLSATTRSRKGKEREGALQVQSLDQGEEPRVEYDSLPLFTRAEDTGMSPPPRVSPTNADNVFDYTEGMKARVKAISEYMDSFDITQAAKMLQIVERQKMQYEQRDQSQRQRIQQLVEENKELTAEVTRLKAALAR